MRMSILHFRNCPANRNKYLLTAGGKAVGTFAFSGHSIHLPNLSTRKPWTTWRAHFAYESSMLDGISGFACWHFLFPSFGLMLKALYEMLRMIGIIDTIIA